MKSNLKHAIFYIVMIGMIIIAATTLWQSFPTDDVSFSDVIEMFEGERVKSFVVEQDNKLRMDVRVVLENGTETTTTVVYKLRDLGLFWTVLGDTIGEQQEQGIIEEYDIPAPDTIPAWVSFLPSIIIIVLLIAVWIFAANQAMGGRGARANSFGRAKVRTNTADMPKVFFKDVAGADEEKAELEELVEFLRDPAYFTKLGAKIPHGVLLVGPPGTGKTLLAKAVAGESGVPFFSISGSDFVEMYVGVGASRVRDLFENAKKSPAAIIFIDEIDAVGRQRGTGLGGGHDEREQTLNQLLVEMDGFGTNDGVIVMAATNRPDVLDPALLRPGRFDRQITVGYPDVKGREEILRVHSKNKPFEKDVSLEVIARTTVGFTGADLANLLNEAALLAARKGKQLIGMNDIEESMLKIIVGTQKRSRVVTEKDKRVTAYHEAGHAIVGYKLQEDRPVHHISIIPSGRAAGFTLSMPKNDNTHTSRTEMTNEIAVLLAGRVAESLIGDIHTGASNDIQRASQIARSMVTKYGMSNVLGPIQYGSATGNDEVFLGRDFNHTQNYSDETASTIDAEVKRIISEAYEQAKKILSANMDKLDFVSGFLMKNEVMEEEQFRRAMEEPFVTYEELEYMVAAKRRKSEEENEARARHIAEMERKREEERAREAARREQQPPQPRPDDDRPFR
jgi:cell division protease FtsH